MSLTKTEMDVLNDLERNGDNVPGNIADNTGRHEKSVSRVLSQGSESLQGRGLVETKGRGVWTITEQGIKEMTRYVNGKIEEDIEK